MTNYYYKTKFSSNNILIHIYLLLYKSLNTIYFLFFISSTMSLFLKTLNLSSFTISLPKALILNTATYLPFLNSVLENKVSVKSLLSPQYIGTVSCIEIVFNN